MCRVWFEEFEDQKFGVESYLFALDFLLMSTSPVLVGEGELRWKVEINKMQT